MPKTVRDPINHGFLQSDLDGNGKNIVNVGAVGDIQQGTIYVDSSADIGDAIGQINTGLPFKTLSAAVAAAEPGDTIIMRPGAYFEDGIITISNLPGLKIFGYGAHLVSATGQNEIGKILIRSGNVLIEGLELDGLVDVPSLPVDFETIVGAIEIDHALGVTIRNVTILDQAGRGIHFVDNYDGSEVVGCNIQNCFQGILVETGIVTGNQGIKIDGNTITRCRSGGHAGGGAVECHGSGNVAGTYLTDLRITNNDFYRNGTSASEGTQSISVSDACRGVLISGNWIDAEYDGIILTKVQNATVEGNILHAVSNAGISLIGCQGVTVDGNIIDGRNVGGTAAINAPMLVSGFFSVANDAGPYVISNNQFINLKTASVAIAIANADGTVLEGNKINGTISLTALSFGLVSGNSFLIPQTNQAILIDSGTRGVASLTIEGNRYRFTGASIARCITTIDAGGLGIDDIAIIGNHTPVGTTFTTATYGHSGANPASHVSQKANVPSSLTGSAANGWLNDDERQNIPFNTVVVSQSGGDDTTGVRQNSIFPFKTIAAAITAAIAGDVVLVKDGTFNERLSAKNGITVRFVDPAKLVCTSVSGVIQTTAVSQTFKVYHQHTPIVCSQVNVQGIQMSHVGAYIELHGSLNMTGGSGNTYCVAGYDGTLEVWGNLYSANSLCIGNGTGSGSNTLYVIVHGLDSNPTLRSDVTTTVDCPILRLNVIDGLIRGIGGGVKIYPATNLSIFKNCTIQALGAGFAAILFGTASATFKPIFRGCVLVSEGTATKSMDVAAAQTVLLYGETVANKGANPPTNVTFAGGGTYAVDAAVVVDQ